MCENLCCGLLLSAVYLRSWKAVCKPDAGLVVVVLCNATKCMIGSGERMWMNK